MANALGGVHVDVPAMATLQGEEQMVAGAVSEIAQPEPAAALADEDQGALAEFSAIESESHQKRADQDVVFFGCGCDMPGAEDFCCSSKGSVIESAISEYKRLEAI